MWAYVWCVLAAVNMGAVYVEEFWEPAEPETCVVFASSVLIRRRPLGQHAAGPLSRLCGDRMCALLPLPLLTLLHPLPRHFVYMLVVLVPPIHPFFQLLFSLNLCPGPTDTYELSPPPPFPCFFFA